MDDENWLSIDPPIYLQTSLFGTMQVKICRKCGATVFDGEPADAHIAFHERTQTQ